MSAADKQNLGIGFAWLTRTVTVALLGVVLYFVKDIHSDFKAVQLKVAAHDQELAEIKTQLFFITQKNP